MRACERSALSGSPQAAPAQRIQCLPKELKAWNRTAVRGFASGPSSFQSIALPAIATRLGANGKEPFRKKRAWFREPFSSSYSTQLAFQNTAPYLSFVQLNRQSNSSRSTLRVISPW